MADSDDEHTSPQNPDNRIELERQAADEAHKAKILAHPPEGPEGPLHPPVTPRPGATRVVRDRKGGRRVVEVPSTGHSWDGIEEYDNPLPRWWLWTFYATIVWGVFYFIAYPAIPLVNGATRGLLGQSYRSDVAAEIQRFNDANAPIQAKLVETPLEEIAADPELANYTANAGAAIFRTWCAQCHGSGAGGATGYPSLLDNDWLWGGTLEEIHTTVMHGIRDPKDGDTRYSEMPRFGTDELLDNTQIRQVVNHVLELGGLPHDAALAAEGVELFADNCSSCHAEDGTGDRAQGAPDLTDAVWLYGSDPETITRIVRDGPFGVMPAWTGRLSDADIVAVAAYVHSLGGGE
ncbi:MULTISPECIES: cytochrome-c oxidase, cbb3-type subunit III [Paracoccus]|jgi:cytochrome c oxidase cbb3-type subunit 3|uniref:Cbb3-type cytochrome c oxidase subunit n=2 Tax=Pseudomonadota TaxID=1224 RepID=A0A3D9XQM3_PARVE|nr:MULTISPECIES: cytochrome-c oxidase, cbb3-type subunit III [Paracoccus]SFX05207.1 cytochrome c oxidase cbb3-type subunit 3 [Paracoccus pantotrophus]MBT0780930.1 cytochrome-c oxidase, cbb3-type subunit III [Paracoccus sp. pheM1]MCJ1899574.1 cytochrome-c oxidase, cbb3-type subunit III [Paracoccus versutus]MDF3903676.1 cytochrome-c oxidase, cbb3-type subunit III [Paracoccus sp. AS002]REF72744.1 cytochrome c oxidase cbb3-type subunit 3 [Paracoccus versutus]